VPRFPAERTVSYKLIAYFPFMPQVLIISILFYQSNILTWRVEVLISSNDYRLLLPAAHVDGWQSGLC